MATDQQVRDFQAGLKATEDLRQQDINNLLTGGPAPSGRQHAVAGRDFFAGRGASQQPAGFGAALALARGLRRSSRFAGFFFDPSDPAQAARESLFAPSGGPLLTGKRRKTKLSATGTSLGEPTSLG